MVEQLRQALILEATGPYAIGYWLAATGQGGVQGWHPIRLLQVVLKFNGKVCVTFLNDMNLVFHLTNETN